MLALLVVAIVTRQCLVAAGRAACGYGFAWVGHFFFEKNRPATFSHPVYSFAGDWVMFKDILIGRIPSEERPLGAIGVPGSHRAQGRSYGHSRKISHAATAISAKPAQWFHFSDCPRYSAENPANTTSVITSCMPLSCGAV